uniref:uncharacterized protein traf3ip2l n=1 Tax=Doryrhamphus excisus TaxID=161450 RepID=UPI0025AE389D|nr:uncharacterized protein traf3ip2l [Doryrhamphus excisus]
MLPGSKPPNSWFLRKNTPQEDDETMSAEQQEVTAKMDPAGARLCDPFQEEPVLDSHARANLSSCSFPPTPFPSLADSVWLPLSSLSSSWSGYPGSTPSSLNPKELCSCCGDSLPSGHKSPSSLEQPFSLHSDPPSRHHTLPPYMCSPIGAACWAQCPADAFAGSGANVHPCFPNREAHGLPCDCRHPWGGFTRINHSHTPPEKQTPHSMPLSLEQRRVFVTYEADDDVHLSEVIKFVALLRHNGFDTHIDIFEQQFRSISKIDFMERYLSEKEYLIIIIISPKYYDTVTASHVSSPDIDERTCSAVYIHKQLQNEFIQNGCKNFRFIPILFPGAKKCHVPTWLQNTHVYAWPLDRDDILRRLMRVEKYNPPPIGELPTIVSIPI